jgi:hypothetical protein
LTFVRSSIRFLINQPLGQGRVDNRARRRELKSAGRRVILLGARAIGTHATAHHISALSLGATQGLVPFRVIDHRTLDREDALVAIGDEQKERGGDFLPSHAMA